MHISAIIKMLLLGPLFLTSSALPMWPAEQIISCSVKSLSLSSMTGTWKLISGSSRKLVLDTIKRTLTISKADEETIAFEWDGEGSKSVALYHQLDPANYPGVFGTVVEIADGEQMYVAMSVIAFKPRKYMVLYSDADFGSEGHYKWDKGPTKVTKAERADISKAIKCIKIHS